jgi:hypothetical protein
MVIQTYLEFKDPASSRGHDKNSADEPADCKFSVLCAGLLSRVVCSRRLRKLGRLTEKGRPNALGADLMGRRTWPTQTALLSASNPAEFQAGGGQGGEYRVQVCTDRAEPGQGADSVQEGWTSVVPLLGAPAATSN